VSTYSLASRQFAQNELKRKSEIGSGTFGVVFKGKIKGREGPVVIKDMNVSSHSKIIDEVINHCVFFGFKNSLLHSGKKKSS
jgi:serine/threonine protein kinase